MAAYRENLANPIKCARRVGVCIQLEKLQNSLVNFPVQVLAALQVARDAGKTKPAKIGREIGKYAMIMDTVWSAVPRKLTKWL